MPSLSRRRHAPKGPIKTHDDPLPATDPMQPGRCTARARNRHHGQCKQPAIPGGTVCRFHGGAAPQVKDAAMERLRRLQFPAIDRISKLIDQEQFPSVSYAASKDVLDRTLGRATETLEVTHSANTEQLVAILDAWKQRNRLPD